MNQNEMVVRPIDEALYMLHLPINIMEEDSTNDILSRFDVTLSSYSAMKYRGFKKCRKIERSGSDSSVASLSSDVSQATLLSSKP